MAFVALLKISRTGYKSLDEARHALRGLRGAGRGGNEAIDELVQKLAAASTLNNKGKIRVNGVSLQKLHGMLKAGKLTQFLKRVDPNFARYDKVISRYEDLLTSLKPSFPKMNKHLERVQRNRLVAQKLGLDLDDMQNALKLGSNGIKNLATTSPKFAKAVGSLKKQLSVRNIISVTTLAGVIFVGNSIYQFLHRYALANSGCFKSYYEGGKKKTCKVREISCSSKHLADVVGKQKINYCTGIVLPPGNNPCDGWTQGKTDECNNNCNSEYITRKDSQDDPDNPDNSETSDNSEEEDGEDIENLDVDDEEEDTEYFCREMSLLEAFGDKSASLAEGILSFFSAKSFLISLAGGCAVAALTYAILSQITTSTIVLILACISTGVLTFFTLKLLV